MSQPNHSLKQLRCPGCFRTFESQAALKTVEAADRPGVSDIGLECPHCLRWTHVAFTNAALETRGQEIERLVAESQSAADPMAHWRKIGKLQKRYKRDFDAFNRKVLRDGKGIFGP